MTTTFHLNVVDWTDRTDEAFAIEYRITRLPINPNSPEAGWLRAEVGTFNTLEAARQAARDHAGALGLSAIERRERDTDDLVEAYSLGRHGLLTARGTRESYGEWSYQAARENDPARFEALVAEQVDLAAFLEKPTPDTNALLAQIREYKAAILAGEYEDEE